MNWLAVDIGGAYLKVADGLGYAGSQFFPLWKEPDRLGVALRAVISAAPPADHLVATMTGELADCFHTKGEGVLWIVKAISEAADGRHTRIYRLDGQLVAPQIALRDPTKVAASNWHALASFACRYVTRGTALMVDVGSTTTDIVPIHRLRPITHDVSDPERMIRGELVYTGIERSPVCAVVDELPWGNRSCPTAQELFATTVDAYLTLGWISEDPANFHTADGRPMTRQAAYDRLAHSICADRTMFSPEDAQVAAKVIFRAQLAKLEIAANAVIENLPAPPETIVICGRGEFLAKHLVKRLRLAASIWSLAEELGPTVSRSATAHALAILARESNDP